MRRQGWRQRRRSRSTWQEIGQISYFWSIWLQALYAVRRHLFTCMVWQRGKQQPDAPRQMLEEKLKWVETCERDKRNTITASQWFSQLEIWYFLKSTCCKKASLIHMFSKYCMCYIWLSLCFKQRITIGLNVLVYCINKAAGVTHELQK